MDRARRAHTRTAVEQLELSIGDAVEYWRETNNKDESGWRGPAIVCDLSRVQHGRVGIRTSSDRVLTCRSQDLRRQLTYIALEAPLEFHDHVKAWLYVEDHINQLPVGHTTTLGSVVDDDQWVITTATKTHKLVWEAVTVWAARALHCHPTAARIANGVRKQASRTEFAGCILHWWLASQSSTKYYLELADTYICLNEPELAGQQWRSTMYVQLLFTLDDQDHHVQESPEAEEVINDEASRLSTIPEGSESDGTEPSSLAYLAEQWGLSEPVLSEIHSSLQPLHSSPPEEKYRIRPGRTCASLDADDRLVSPLPDEHVGRYWAFTDAATAEILQSATSGGGPELLFTSTTSALLPGSHSCKHYLAVDATVGLHAVVGHYLSREGIRAVDARENIDRSDDVVTSAELEQFWPDVQSAMLEELQRW
eukprot:6491161-Amphidinium_carterae.1